MWDVCIIQNYFHEISFSDFLGNGVSVNINENVLYTIMQLKPFYVLSKDQRLP